MTSAFLRPLILLFGFLLTACSRYPSNDFECRMEASKAPTIAGVREAADACDEKFKNEIAVRSK
jgi:hypothetical protein